MSSVQPASAEPASSLPLDFAAPASAALTAVIAAGARLFVAQPWRVARVIPGVDAMTAGELRAELARRRRGGAPADLNLAIAIAQLESALQSPGFASAWAQWRADERVD